MLVRAGLVSARAERRSTSRSAPSSAWATSWSRGRGGPGGAQGDGALRPARPLPALLLEDGQLRLRDRGDRLRPRGGHPHPLRERPDGGLPPRRRVAAHPQAHLQHVETFERSRTCPRPRSRRATTSTRPSRLRRHRGEGRRRRHRGQTSAPTSAASTASPTTARTSRGSWTARAWGSSRPARP
jgi:hypothetical protein